MKNILIIIKISTWSFCCVFLFDSCRSISNKAIHRKHIIEIKAMKFQPAELIVHRGDTVVWINRDIVPHDVTEEHSKNWTSSVLAAGASWGLVPSESADYYCSIHIVMKGKLVVQ